MKLEMFLLGLFLIVQQGAASAQYQNPEITSTVYFDITIGGQPAGRILIGLFGKVVPKTSGNFQKLATDGANLNELHSYRGSPLYRVNNSMIQGGDFTGTDGFSSFGTKSFADENFHLKHTGPGIVSMANSGPDSNGSRFLITTAKASWLDGSHVVFGKVTSGMAVVNRIKNLPTGPGDRPRQQALIADSGLIVNAGGAGPSDSAPTCAGGPLLLLLTALGIFL